jgi:hypothetical protein
MRSNLSKILIYIFSCTLLSLSCKKDKLPKATQEGKNTFGCKVDGEIYIAQIQGISFSGAKPIVVLNSQNDGFTLSTIDSRTGESYSKRILIQLPYLQTAGSYSLTSFPSYGQFELNYSPGPNYQTDDTHTGTVTITRCDLTNHIYSGTFSFTAIDKNTGKVVKVTDGRFDVKQ